jgi:ureidoglycolate lyase
MPDLELKAMPLTRQAFAPFGDVIELSEHNEIIPINYGLTDRHHDLATVDVASGGGKPIISLFHSRSVAVPFTVEIMERHPLGSQAFFGLGGHPYLVVVGAAGEFDPMALCAFIARGNQGVNYHRGTWHHYCLSLEQDNDFLVVDRGGAGDNCDEVKVPDDLTISVSVSG